MGPTPRRARFTTPGFLVHRSSPCSYLYPPRLQLLFSQHNPTSFWLTLNTRVLWGFGGLNRTWNSISRNVSRKFR